MCAASRSWPQHAASDDDELDRHRRTGRVRKRRPAPRHRTATDAPAATDAPSATEAPSGSDAPVRTEAPAAEGEPIIIGLQNPEGDPNGSFPEYSAAVQAAVDYINTELGGLGGRPIELEICKTAISPDDSQRCANELVAEEVD